jgi:hypothetical protein
MGKILTEDFAVGGIGVCGKKEPMRYLRKWIRRGS